MAQIREPVAAGQFYPGSATHLSATIKKFLAAPGDKRKVKAIMCPHAGYIYSGSVAGLVYGSIEIPEKAIILAPNHTGYGEPYSLGDFTGWKTPLGIILTEETLRAKLLEKSRYLQSDPFAHWREHSLEVQLPFLRYLKPDIKIVGLCLSGPVQDQAWAEIAGAISQSIEEIGQPVLIVASSDLSHENSQEVTEENDRFVLRAILDLDELELARRIEERQVTMCGYAPVTVAIIAAKNLGATRATLLRYTTSADVTGQTDYVVGYAGVVFE
ncbi:MAG: AmmeMemoRadiSam system protein B [Candidatus Omnitrophica bacterium]|nr:AmmeMemoRadiSam system protein B [Candidatus Omnitrophota bacterium]